MSLNMAQFRPAGLSDEDTDSDDYGFYEKPVRNYNNYQTTKKKLEINLQDAIINGNVEDVKNIIANDLHNNVDIKLDSGWTPLMHACFHAQDQIVKLLLDMNADPNLHSDSVTPLMAACSNSSANNDTIYNIIENLICKDCILNIGDKYGQTPLMRAISSSRVAVVQKLLDMNINIEMRDQQGWTALFWAVHHKQPEILEMLIDKGARLTEVDKSGRTALAIAESHDFLNIIDILKKHLNDKDENEMDKTVFLDNEVKSWHDYYPGIEKREGPNYSDEIAHFLYGMNCERLTPLFKNSKMDLRTFLLLEESDMIKLGIDMPYERQRLKRGLRSFHLRGWKLNAVSGLYTKKVENFSVLDCLTTLGNHLQQIYILEATLHYTLREYTRLQNQIKFEPPDSPILGKIKAAAKNTLNNINSIRREIRNMKNILTKISRNNPQPVDIISEPTAQEIVIGYLTDTVIVCSIGIILYHAKSLIINTLKK